MIDFKLLRGDLKQTLLHGDFRMTLEVMEDNLLFVEIKHIDGDISASVSEVIELEYRFGYYVEYGSDMLRYYCEQPLSVRTILMDTIFAMRHA